MKKVCLTFDIEDWFQVENLRSVFSINKWDDQELRVEKNTRKILDILDEANVKATFFVLGWIAKKVPDLIKDINNKGHEIASHGFNHLLNYDLNALELKKDLSDSKKLLEDLIGKEVVGYRAPSFSISDELMNTLSKLGYKYDSSFNDFSKHDRYGKLSGAEGSKPFLHKSGIYEFPMPVTKLFEKNLPISGGGYFRIVPFPIFKKCVNAYIDENDLYIFYMHPWELDYEQPRIKNIKLSYRIRHYVGLNKTKKRLIELIEFLAINFNTNFVTLRGML